MASIASSSTRWNPPSTLSQSRSTKKVKKTSSWRSTDFAFPIEEDYAPDDLPRNKNSTLEDESYLKLILFEDFKAAIDKEGPDIPWETLHSLFSGYQAQRDLIQKEEGEGQMQNDNREDLDEHFESLYLEQRNLLQKLMHEQPGESIQQQAQERAWRVRNGAEEEQRNATLWPKSEGSFKQELHNFYNSPSQTNSNPLGRNNRDEAPFTKPIRGGHIHQEAPRNIPQRLMEPSSVSKSSNLNGFDPFWNRPTSPYSAASYTSWSSSSTRQAPLSPKPGSLTSGSSKIGGQQPLPVYHNSRALLSGTGSAPSSSSRTSTPIPERWIPPEGIKTPPPIVVSQSEPSESKRGRKESILFGDSPSLPSRHLDDAPSSSTYLPRSSPLSPRPESLKSSSSSSHPPSTPRWDLNTVSVEYPAQTPTKSSPSIQQEDRLAPSSHNSSRAVSDTASIRSLRLDSPRPETMDPELDEKRRRELEEGARRAEEARRRGEERRRMEEIARENARRGKEAKKLYTEYRSATPSNQQRINFPAMEPTYSDGAKQIDTYSSNTSSRRRVVR